MSAEYAKFCVCYVTLYPEKIAADVKFQPNKSIGVPKTNDTVLGLMDVIEHLFPKLSSRIQAARKSASRTAAMYVRRGTEVLKLTDRLNDSETLSLHIIPAVPKATLGTPRNAATTPRVWQTLDAEYRMYFHTRPMPSSSKTSKRELLIDGDDGDDADFEEPEGLEEGSTRAEDSGASAEDSAVKPVKPPVRKRWGNKKKMKPYMFVIIEPKDESKRVLPRFDQIRTEWAKPLPPTSVLLGEDGPARRAAFEQLTIPGTRCFWVIPDAVLAGPAPVSEELLRPILETGVRTFIDLRMNIEGDEYAQLANELLAEMVEEGLVPATDPESGQPSPLPGAASAKKKRFSAKRFRRMFSTRGSRRASANGAQAATPVSATVPTTVPTTVAFPKPGEPDSAAADTAGPTFPKFPKFPKPGEPNSAAADTGGPSPPASPPPPNGTEPAAGSPPSPGHPPEGLQPGQTVRRSLRSDRDQLHAEVRREAMDARLDQEFEADVRDDAQEELEFELAYGMDTATDPTAPRPSRPSRLPQISLREHPIPDLKLLYAYGSGVDGPHAPNPSTTVGSTDARTRFGTDRFGTDSCLPTSSDAATKSEDAPFPLAPDLAIDHDARLARLTVELHERAARGEKMYIHCSQGHGRTGTVCTLLLAMAYHISGPHAILLYQALHDTAAKAFRRELRASDVQLEFEGNDADGEPVVYEKVIRGELAYSFTSVQRVAAALGVEHRNVFVAVTPEGDEVRVTDDESLSTMIDKVLNVEQPSTAIPVLRLLPLSDRAMQLADRRTASTLGLRAASADVRSLKGALPASFINEAELVSSMSSTPAALDKMKLLSASHGMGMDEGLQLVRLLTPDREFCHAMNREQIWQVLRLLTVATRAMKKGVKKEHDYRAWLAEYHVKTMLQRRKMELQAQAAAERREQKEAAEAAAASKRRWRRRMRARQAAASS